MFRVGLISDTHGLLRPEALTLLQGADHVIHAGDIGDLAILDTLSAIAPVTAVRGNNDHAAHHLRETERVELQGVHFFVIHDLNDLELRPAPREVRVIVSGHSHKPSVIERAGVLCINPGSAGPRRFRLPVTLAELTIEHGAVAARVIELPVAPR